MRDVPEPPVGAWQPPKYEVDGHGKVVGAEPGTPNNWGRWGSSDQKGTANLCTPERVVAAAGLVRTGERFALGLPIGGIDTPTYRAPVQHHMIMAAGNAVLGERAYDLAMSDDAVTMALQLSTQLDGLAHVGADEYMYNGYWAGLITTSGAKRLSVHQIGDGIVGRGVLLDVARYVGADPLPAGMSIGPAELDATADAQNVEVRPGDAVLVRTGWLGANIGKTGRPANEPGLSPRAVPWFADHDTAAVGIDTATLELMEGEPGHRPLAFHIGAIRDLGLQLCEMLDLDALAAACAADGVYEFMFVMMPLQVVGGVGSPINPVAIR